MRVVAVLDLMDGRVVRGVGGRRGDYRPIVSRLTASSRPLDVARAFRDRFGLTELYVAGLDAIGGGPPADDVFAALRGDGFRLWVDAGVREMERVRTLAAAGVETVVVGLETAAGPAVLAAACREFGERIVFSLDLRGGVPEGEWGGDASEIARTAIGAGVRRLLVLDVAQVGGGGGTGTEALCARLAAAFPDVELSAGGGIRDIEDLRQLKSRGVRAALVASALHDGVVTLDDLAKL